MAQNPRRGFVPLIPGMRSTHHDQTAKPHFRRGQLLERMALGKLTTAERATPTASHSMVSAVSSASKRPQDSTKAAAEARRGIASSKYRVDASQPAWLTHDRLVLRFFAYFAEPVELADGRVEQRIRRVVVCFYLSDRSLSISEPRVANSGIAQGEFMRRTAVRKPSRGSDLDDQYAPEDFRVGGELRLYGRTFHLVDCDEATRRFYAEALGRTLSSPCKYPDESGSKTDEVEQLKTQLRARTRAIGASEAEATRKFHDLSQKVLRFFTSWRDEHPLYPETRRFVLHYYLCDDTVEVVEAREDNRGRGGGVLLSRRKLVRELDGRNPSQQKNEQESSYFVTCRDLRCGEWVTVFSRRLLLEDCDPFTRDYYLETYGVTQEKFEPPLIETPAPEAKWKLFQSTQQPSQAPVASNIRGTSGYAVNNNNSSMRSGLAAPIPEASVRHGSSHARRLGFTDTPLCGDDELDGKQLRFRARFQGVPSGDLNAQREFVVTFFLEDETLAVFEPRVRNSGVLGGRFLDRARFRKNLGSGGAFKSSKEPVVNYYRAADLYVGAVLSFEFSPHQRLELVEADSQTLSYCESHPEVFLFSDSVAVLALVAKVWLEGSKRVDLRCECRKLGQNRAHTIDIDDLKHVLDRAGLASSLNAQQMLTLCRRFSVYQVDAAYEDENNQKPGSLFAYDEFCDAVASLVTSSCLSKDPDHGIRAKLAKVADLRRLLSSIGSRCGSNGLVSVRDLLSVASDRRIALSKTDVGELTARFAVNSGILDVHRLCDHVFRLPTGPHKPLDAEDIDHGLSFANQSEETTAFPSERVTKHISAVGGRLASSAPKSVLPTVDARVVSLLQRVFTTRKYQLRKALRDHDHEKSGRLREEEFMAAVLSVAPQLSDDDSYLLADAFFPTNNSSVEYPQLLDRAFRT
ncbi:hypothetical protein BBJ28_00009138 [Nothophytophthora sp. Chile5]|nr:hypothetical protein BBJ28_00009138 [Nothophytophthora sp. Chile5]